MIALAFIAASAPVDTPVQRQLDFIVARCRAEKIVRLVAEDGNQVRMEMLKAGALPTVSENSALQCALAKVKERSDLHLGFTGKETAK